MKNNVNDAIGRIKQRVNVLKERKEIQKKIRFLQRSMVQVSLGAHPDRPELYKSLRRSLEKARQQLLENKNNNVALRS